MEDIKFTIHPPQPMKFSIGKGESGPGGGGDMKASIYDAAGGKRQVAFSDQIPTKTSDLENDSGYITQAGDTVTVIRRVNTGINIADIIISGETTKLFAPTSGGGGGITEEVDPLFSASPAAGITDEDIESWDAKGTYSKPSGGIPKTDLASAVQTSLGKADTAVQPETGKGLFSGSYNDLDDKPNIPAEQVNADWDATSGKAQILHKPSIPTVPTNVSAFTNDAGYLKQHQSLAAYRTASAQDAIDVGKMPSVAVTSADNGKVLMVVNGTWAASNLPVYDGSVT